MPTRKKISYVVLFLAIHTMPGCVTVNPQEDYQKTRTLIQERAPDAAVYDPEAEGLIEQQVAGLLADGVTIDEAVSIALLNNKGLQALFQEIGMSRAEVVQSGLLTNPTLSLGFRLPEGGGRSELTAGLAQQIVDLWQIPVRERIAEAQLQRSILQVAQHAHRLALDVRRSYLSLLTTDRAIELASEHTRLVERSLGVAQARVEAGEAEPFEVNLTRGSFLEARVDLASLQGDRDVAEIALARAMGVGRSVAQWTINGTLPQPRSLTLDPQYLIVAADLSRLDVLGAEAGLAAAEDELIRQCRNVFPSIIVGATGERTERAAMPGRDVLADTARASIAAGQLTAPSIQSKSQRDQERSHFIDGLLGGTVTMTVPIWDQNQAGIAKARFAVIQRRKQLEDLRDQVAHDVYQAASKTRTLTELTSLYEKDVLPNDSLNVEGATALYETGQQNILVLIEAQQAMILHRRRYLDSLRNYGFALIDLELAVGGQLPAADATLAPNLETGLQP